MFTHSQIWTTNKLLRHSEPARSAANKRNHATRFYSKKLVKIKKLV